MFIRSADEVHLQSRAPGIADRTDPSAVYDVAENIESPSLGRVSRHLADIPMNFERTGMHHHSGKILRMTMDTHPGAHIECTTILPRASINVHTRIGGHPGAHPHSDAPLSFHSIDDEPPPSHPMGVIEETAQDV